MFDSESGEDEPDRAPTGDLALGQPADVAMRPLERIDDVEHVLPGHGADPQDGPALGGK